MKKNFFFNKKIFFVRTSRKLTGPLNGYSLRQRDSSRNFPARPLHGGKYKPKFKPSVNSYK